MGRVQGKVAIVTLASERFGRLDVRVNNAGIAVLKPLEQLTLADWNRQLEVNLTSVFLGCRYAMQASKTVAIEGAPHNIRCNSVHPGVIWTNMQAQAVGTNDASLVPVGAQRVPLGRMGQPQDIAHCVLYLASDESNYVTGAEYTVDAGMTAQ